MNRMIDICLLKHEIDGYNKIINPHELYLFFFVVKGSGNYRIDSYNYQVRDNQIHILLPGQVPQWDLCKVTQGFHLMLSEKSFQTLEKINTVFSSSIIDNYQVLELSNNDCAALIYEFESFYLEFNLEAQDLDIIFLRCNLILKLISRLLIIEDKKDNIIKLNPILLSYEVLIDTHFRSNKLVSFYAEKLNVTPNYLNVLCNKYFNKSATSFIQDRVILEAKRLLQVSQFSVKEIAYKLGFSEPAYFSNFFKLHTGISPRKFRA